VKTGEPLHYEYSYVHKGIKKWFETEVVKLDDGFAVTFADITEKKEADEKIHKAYRELKHAEEKLKKLNNELEQTVKERTLDLYRSEERFRLVSHATNDIVWDWDIVRNTFTWNEGLKSLGYSKEDISPGIEFWYERIHPQDKDRTIQSLQAAINSGSSQWSGEYRFLKSDGSYAYLLDRGYVLHDESAIPYRMVGSKIDLSELKKIQEELENTNKSLIKINSDLDNFIYTASHDLKAPISNIEGLMHTLSEYVNTEQDEVSQILSMMDLSIRRFKETIKDLTEITRLQKENVEDIQKISISEILEEAKFNIKDIIKNKDAEIKTDFQVPEIKFSRKNLRSILYNLLSNAIKYSAPDRKPVVNVSTAVSGNYVLLTVEDNGLGIPSHKQDLIFSMFKRLHDHVEGTGVGLYIVKKIIDNAGGKIQVESQEGKGTTFKVYFKS
jgi:two-component system, chemotaxis family, CheB/CheR fusion protein